MQLNPTPKFHLLNLFPTAVSHLTHRIFPVLHHKNTVGPGKKYNVCYVSGVSIILVGLLNVETRQLDLFYLYHETFRLSSISWTHCLLCETLFT